MIHFSKTYEYIRSGGEKPDMSDLCAKAYDLYSDSVRDARPVMLHQEQARANDCEIVDIFRDGGIRRFAVFAFEGEEDDVKDDIEKHGYVYRGIGHFAIRDRLFAYCMDFEWETINQEDVLSVRYS